MNIDLTLIQTGAVVAVPIIVALCQAVKMTGFISNKFMPLVSIGIGIIITMVSDHELGNMSGALMTGVMYGLMASGLYSGLKSSMETQPRAEAETEEKKY